MFNDIFAKIFIIGTVAFILFCGFGDIKQGAEYAKQKYVIETSDYIYYTNEYTIKDGCVAFDSFVSSKPITACGSYVIR